MELLQLIFSVIAGLAAGAMGALIVARREETDDFERNIAERLQELEQQSSVDRDRVERLNEIAESGDRDLRNRLQAALGARDERLDAFMDRLQRVERASIERAKNETTSQVPQQRLQTRLDTTAGRIETVEAALRRLEQRIQARLIAFREGTQEVLRRLAEHQVEEAERVTRLTWESTEVRRQLDSGQIGAPDDRPTTAALVEVLESQVMLTERANRLDHRFNENLQQLEQQLTTVESRLRSVDNLHARLSGLEERRSESEQIAQLQRTVAALEARLEAAAQAPQPLTAVEPVQVAEPTPVEIAAPARRLTKAALKDLKQIVGIGPKLAKQLSKNGVKDIPTLAALDDGDLERLAGRIRGFKDRQARHDWVGQAKRLIGEPADDENARVRPPAGAAPEANGAAPESNGAPPHAVVDTAPPLSNGTASSGNGAHEAETVEPSTDEAPPSPDDDAPPANGARTPNRVRLNGARPNGAPGGLGTPSGSAERTPPGRRPTPPPGWPVGAAADPDAIH